MRSSLFLSLCLVVSSQAATAQQALLRQPAVGIPTEYVPDFVSTTAFGVDMSLSGDVIGSSYPDPGCGPFCLPPLETVVWRGEQRIVLPSVPGLSGTTVRGINDDGWIVGFAGTYTTTHAVLWRPVDGSYHALDLGTLPGTTISEAVGIDEQGRVVGWSTTQSFPPNGSPFLWSESTGMVDLSQLGYPDDLPLAISPGGTVATPSSWYRLGDPSSVTPLAAAPAGYGAGSHPTAINDAGDQARFLVRTSGQSLVYLYRYHHEGTWQLVSPSPTGHLSRYGIGSINEHKDITATVTSTGVLARGPNGLAQSLASLLSEAWVYPDRASTAVTMAGPMNGRGEILADVMLGRSQRLVRLKPASFSGWPCLRVTELGMESVYVHDPSAPGSCSPSLNAYTETLVTLRVTTPGGAPAQAAVVSGRFLDDYWTSQPVVGVTDSTGLATFFDVGLCGTGAIEFLVEDARAGGLKLDENAGRLSIWQIPQL